MGSTKLLFIINIFNSALTVRPNNSSGRRRPCCLHWWPDKFCRKQTLFQYIGNGQWLGATTTMGDRRRKDLNMKIVKSQGQTGRRGLRCTICHPSQTSGSRNTNNNGNVFICRRENNNGKVFICKHKQQWHCVYLQQGNLK